MNFFLKQCTLVTLLIIQGLFKNKNIYINKTLLFYIFEKFMSTLTIKDMPNGNFLKDL